MSVRIGVAVLSIVVSIGALSAACSVPARPVEVTPAAPSSSSHLAEPSSLPAPAPGVSWLRVSPEQGAQGAAVSLDVACLDNLGSVNSPVLDIGALKANSDGHQPWHRFGTATVASGATPGRYQISATCGTDELSAAFTVVSTR